MFWRISLVGAIVLSLGPHVLAGDVFGLSFTGDDSAERNKNHSFRCDMLNPLIYNEGSFTFIHNRVSESFTVRLGSTPSFDSSFECWDMQSFYENRAYAYDFETAISRLTEIPSPPTSGAPSSGMIEYVPLPCKPCETDRKDRKFIRGIPYSNSAAKLLVDFASAQSGGKLLSHSENLRGVSDIIHSDDSRYLLTLCSNKVWFTIRLSDEVFVEKIGITASELFASTFRHIQILGSKQYPTSEWRVLGEIETNPMENQELFDISGSSQCAKCYVKYLKVRVLTHHTLEGYSNCALTRVQVFGSTVLQNLDKIQTMGNVTINSASYLKTPWFVKSNLENLVSDHFDHRVWTITGEHMQVSGVGTNTGSSSSESGSGGSTIGATPASSTKPHEQYITDYNVDEQNKKTSDNENSPLVKLLEDMTLLKKQYAAVTQNLAAMTESLSAQSQAAVTAKAQQKDAFNVTSVNYGKPNEIIIDVPHKTQFMLSLFGISFPMSLPNFNTDHILLTGLFAIQFVIIVFLWNKKTVTQHENMHSRKTPVQSPNSQSLYMFARDFPPFNIRRRTSTRSKPRRAKSFMHYMKEIKRHVNTNSPSAATVAVTTDSPIFRSPPESIVDLFESGN